MKPAICLALPILLLATACEDTSEPDAPTNEQGGEVAGDVLGGSISDDMIPLDELRSQSPPAEQSTTTTVTSRTTDGETSVETTVETTIGEDGPSSPTPPEPPAAPE